MPTTSNFSEDQSEASALMNELHTKPCEILQTRTTLLRSFGETKMVYPGETKMVYPLESSRFSRQITWPGNGAFVESQAPVDQCAVYTHPVPT